MRYIFVIVLTPNLKNNSRYTYDIRFVFIINARNIEKCDKINLNSHDIILTNSKMIEYDYLTPGDCNVDQFIIRANEPLPVLCGHNTNQHLYIDVRGR